VTQFDGVLIDLMRAAEHDARLRQFRSLASARQYVRAYELVTRHVAPGSAVLDWGAGNGHFSYFLIQTDYRTSGFGFDGLPSVCAPFAPDRYVYKDGDYADPVTIPFDDGAFDAVVSIGVLEHVRETGGDEAASLREIHRLLKPGGLFVCFHLPNRNSWIEWGLRRVGRWSHQFRYTAESIHALCAQAGLDPIEVRRYGALPRNVWQSSRLKQMGNSAAIASAYDTLDGALGVLVSPLDQCYLFAAKKT
jgi:SAM-dependent methyltransferase